jgi:hypothetical protein
MGVASPAQFAAGRVSFGRQQTAWVRLQHSPSRNPKLEDPFSDSISTNFPDVDEWITAPLSHIGMQGTLTKAAIVL